MVNLYAENTADIELDENKVEIEQKTDYPWEGKVDLTINPDEEQPFELRLRIPGWARNEAVPGKLYRFTDSKNQPVEVTVNGEKVETQPEDGYIVIDRKWRSGDKVSLDMPMPVRIIEANKKVKEDHGKVAVQRGPIIYAAEWPDNPKGEVLNLVFDKNSKLTADFKPDMLNGVPVIKGKASRAKKTLEDEVVVSEKQDITLIPYHTWANRGPGEMRVWLPFEKEATIPSPAPTIAAKSQITASAEKESLRYLNDQLEPVTTSALRLKIQLPEKHSSGIVEWIVE